MLARAITRTAHIFDATSTSEKCLALARYTTISQCSEYHSDYPKGTRRGAIHAQKTRMKSLRRLLSTADMEAASAGPRKGASIEGPGHSSSASTFSENEISNPEGRRKGMERAIQSNARVQCSRT